MKMCQENPDLLQLGQNIWHFTWRPKKVVLCPVTLKRHKSSLEEWNGIRLLEQPKWHKHYANMPKCYVIPTMSILTLFHSSSTRYNDFMDKMGFQCRSTFHCLTPRSKAALPAVSPLDYCPTARCCCYISNWLWIGPGGIRSRYIQLFILNIFVV